MSLMLRLLLRFYPASIRNRDEDVLLLAFRTCVERERARAGAVGAVYAWIVLFADAAVSGSTLRIQNRRHLRIQGQGLPRPPKEPHMQSLWYDVRHAARAMRRAWGFSLVVVGTLALGIGANTAIFTVVDAVLLQPLPYREAERLVMLYQAVPKAISGPIGFSAPDYTAFRQRATSYESIAAFVNREYELSGVDRPERVTGARVSASLFPTLRVEPALGRSFTEAEDLGGQRVVVITDGLWRRAFGADPQIVGRSISVDRQPYTVAGIMPRGFVFPERGPTLNNKPAELYVPISFTTTELRAFGSMYNNSVVGRLKRGVAPAEADAEARAVSGQLVNDIYPATLKQLGLQLSASATPLRDETVGKVTTALYVLLAAVAVVLLIACADIANLMLTRATMREREMAVRAALGAARWRLVRQVLIEAGVLSLAGGMFGLFMAYAAVAALVSVAPPDTPRLQEIAISARVLLFAFAASALTALLCGGLPAWESATRHASGALKEGGRGGTQGVRHRRIFGALVTAQFALAVVLLVAGGLLIRSFGRLLAVDGGFRADHVLTLSTSLPSNAYRAGSEIRGFYDTLLERVSALPGVESVGAGTDLPLSVRERRAFTIETQPAASANLPHTVAHDWIMGHYLNTMGISLKRGRYLTPADAQTSERVVVINETLARQFWPDEDPVGQRIAWGSALNHGGWMRIVGIVGDVKQGPLNSTTVPQTYSPWAQVSDDMIANTVWAGFRSLKLVVRTTADPLTLASSVREQVRSLDASLPVARLQTMEQVVSESVDAQRFNTYLLGGFAATALLLAGLGIASVLGTSVSARTQEMGVRIALGAQRRDLLRLVVGQGMFLVGIGLVVGVPAAFGAARLISSLLFGIGPNDSATFAGVIGILVAVALVACYIPASRATRVDPIVTLRAE